MVKWIDTCQVSQEVFFSPKQLACLPSLGPPFRFVPGWLSLPADALFPAMWSEHQQWSKEKRALRQYESSVWSHHFFFFFVTDTRDHN